MEEGKETYIWSTISTFYFTGPDVSGLLKNVKHFDINVPLPVIWEENNKGNRNGPCD